jgi:hypothetical protein
MSFYKLPQTLPEPYPMRYVASMQFEDRGAQQVQPSLLDDLSYRMDQWTDTKQFEGSYGPRSRQDTYVIGVTATSQEFRRQNNVNEDCGFDPAKDWEEAWDQSAYTEFVDSAGAYSDLHLLYEELKTWVAPLGYGIGRSYIVQVGENANMPCTLYYQPKDTVYQLHVPITTHSKAFFAVQGDEYVVPTMYCMREPGALYLARSDTPTALVNLSGTETFLHLVFNLYRKP